MGFCTYCSEANANYKLQASYKLHASYVSAYLDQEVLLQALGLLLVSLAL